MEVRGRPILTLIFIGLLILPALLKNRQQSGPSGASLERHGFSLTESAKACGIDFVHGAPVFDAKVAHIMPQIAAMGASVSVSDFDRDGWPDLYVTTSAEGAPNGLFRNLGNGKFEDVAAKLGVADLNRKACCTGSVWGDYDNDGFEDLFVIKWGACELFHNEGGKGFKKVEKTGFPAWVNANSAIWLDFDRDGKLDLLIGGYWDERVDLWHLTSTKMMPESFEYALNGGRKYLLKGKGDGSFTDVTEAMGITTRRWALSVGAADIFGTGYPDIFIANDYGISELYRNQAGKGFVEVSKETGIGAAPKSGMNVSFGDVFNKGQLAAYISNISEEGILIQGNNLWVPRGRPENLRFENMARVLGVELGGWSFGAQFTDLNNDGFLDLFLVNGFISADPKSSYWYDFTKVAGGHAAIISDAANWPPMNGRSHAGYQAKKVWLNDGTGRFADVAQEAGVTETLDGRAIACADFWNRGVSDIVVATQKGPVLLYKNTVNPANGWLELELEGTVSNRSAIGARVLLTWGDKQQVQELHGGSGFAAQNDRRLRFGLGKGAGAASAKIRWPSGKEQVLDKLEPNRLHKVKEPA